MQVYTNNRGVRIALVAVATVSSLACGILCRRASVQSEAEQVRMRASAEYVARAILADGDRVASIRPERFLEWARSNPEAVISARKRAIQAHRQALVEVGELIEAIYSYDEMEEFLRGQMEELQRQVFVHYRHDDLRIPIPIDAAKWPEHLATQIGEFGQDAWVKERVLADYRSGLHDSEAP